MGRRRRALARSPASGELDARALAASRPRRSRPASPARAALLALLALLLAAMLALGAASAQAVIVRLSNSKTLSYQPLRGATATFGPARPFDEFFSNVDYNGGPLMASNANYAFYWDPAGGASYPADYQSGIDQYLEDLAHDSGGHENVDSVSTQYNDAAGAFANYESRFEGAIVDTNPYPANGCKEAPVCLTDSQLRAELASYVSAHGLPADLAHEYFLLTPPGVEDCFGASGKECSAGAGHAVYCAYHGNIRLGARQIVYANDPYVTGNLGCDDGNHPSGKPSDGALEGGLSHEHNESITDPEPNNAWADVVGESAEIADKCAGVNGAALGNAPNGAKYNQLINGHEYWYQQEWSNQTHGCLQRLSFSGAEPTASFTGTPGGANAVEFDAGGSTAPGGVAHYNWQFNDGPGQSTPTETSSPTVAHSFPASGSYVVALTVFAADGTSIGAAHAIIVGEAPTPKVTKLAPKIGLAAGGTSVTINGSSFSGATAVSFSASPAAGFTVNSATSITAVSPAGSTGTVDVTVTGPTGTSPQTVADRFKFGSPTVTAVSPGSGSKAGGTSVTISGTGFALGAVTKIKFGKVAAKAVNCTSTSSCTTSSPAAAKSGLVDVKVTVAGLSSKKNAPADRFRYL